jgi:hypothetical protein
MAENHSQSGPPLAALCASIEVKASHQGLRGSPGPTTICLHLSHSISALYHNYTFVCISHVGAQSKSYSSFL